MSKVTKADHIDPSAAISARSFQSVACRKFETKAMVIIRSSRKPGSQDEEMPDWSDARQEDEEDWHMASYEETELRLREDLKQNNIHAVDVINIGTKSDPIPIKDLDDMKFKSSFEDDGVYCG